MKKSLLTNRLKYLLVLLLAAMTATKAVAQEAYAELSGSTLTFYYDTNRSSRSGNTYDMNSGSNKPGWAENTAITTVTFNSSFSEYKPTSCCKWFYKLNNLTTINYLTNLCFDEVTTTQQMFQETKLTSIEFQYNNYNNTAKLTNMSQMFGNNPYLQEIRNLNMFNTANVTTMEYMFYLCSKLTTLDLRSPDEKGRWNTSKVTNMQNMFYGCSNLTTIQVERGWYVGNVTNSEGMFTGCTKLVGGNGTAFNSQYTDKTYAHLDSENFPGYFSGTIRVEPYVVKSANESTLTFYYDKMRYIRPGIAYDLNSGINSPEWTGVTVTTVEFDQTFSNYNPTTTARWFENCSNLTTIDGIENLNTSKVTTMYCMFSACKNRLTELNLSAFNTAKVTDMRLMFNQCTNLKTIKVGSGWTTNAVTQSTEMFRNCTSLVGGEGTAYNASYIDKTRARIDGGTSSPGYLTEDKPEAYAVYTSDNTTLTFYYDNLRSTRPGVIYDVKSNISNSQGWYQYHSSITTVVFDDSFADTRLVSASYMFYKMDVLATIKGLNNFNTSEITSMSNMFSDCEALTTLDLSGFDTSKVTYMGNMFARCYGLTTLDLSSFNTSEVTNMSNMFYGCSSLTSLDLSSFNTSKVTSTYAMFATCSSLSNIYVGEDWDMSNVQQSDGMFAMCTELVGSASTTYNENYIDKARAHIDGGTANPGYLSAPKEAYAVYTLANTTLTFYYDALRSTRSGTTYSLNTITNNPGWYNDGTYQNVNTVTFDPSFADARPTTTANWFKNMAKLTTINNIFYLNTSEVVFMTQMFIGCSKLQSLNLSSFNTAKVTSMVSMFYSCSSLTELNLNGWNTANVTSMAYMFYNTKLKNLNLASFNTAKVNNMTDMFRFSSSLKSISVDSGWTTASVTASPSMYHGCTSLVGSPGTTYNAANPHDKTYAHIDGGTDNPGYLRVSPYVAYDGATGTLTFYCDDKRSEKGDSTYNLNVSDDTPEWVNKVSVGKIKKVVFDESFASARPTTTHYWFYYMENLTDIQDLENLNTSEMTNMDYMFMGCSSLTTLDLRSLNTGNVKTTDGMFMDCGNLAKIYVGGGFSIENVLTSSLMFDGCSNLVGLAGTKYSADHTDASYAHIDEGTSNPGYFSVLPYAVYDGTSTLTFYNDNDRDAKTGTIYELITGTSTPEWSSVVTSITTVVFDTSFIYARPTSTHSWFNSMTALTTITGISNLNTSLVTNMSNMFNGCTALNVLDLSGFNTQNVTNMIRMFQGCTKLYTIYAGSGWTTSNVPTIGSLNMFAGCTNLMGGSGTTYNPRSTNAAAAKIDANGTHGYLSLKPYAVYNSRVTTLTFKCDGNRPVRPTTDRFSTYYDIPTDASTPGWYGTLLNSPNKNCTTVVFDESFQQTRPVSTAKWFYDMPNLMSINGLENLNTSNTRVMAEMFYGASALISLNLSHFITARVQMIRRMFYGCSNLTTIYGGNGWDLRGLGTSTAQIAATSTDMFTGCTKLVGGAGTTYNASNVNATYAQIDGGSTRPGYFTQLGETYACLSDGTLTFYYDNNRSSRTGTTYDLNTESNAPGWNSSASTVTTVVFASSFTYARPTTTYKWFNNMTNLTTITDIKYLNTSMVTNMAFMFCNNGMTSLDLSKFNTSNVTDMSSMFDGCTSLTSLDLSKFSMANVENMSGMFFNCSQLNTLDLTGFDTSNLTNTFRMFAQCTSLTTIYVSDVWTTDLIENSDGMFLSCNNLVGGAGTTYDNTNQNVDYAHIDGGTSDPGYLTDTTPHPYAWVSADGTTLTFCYDYMRAARVGNTYSLNTYYQGAGTPPLPGWVSQTANTTLTDVVFNAEFAQVRPESTYAWFYKLQTLSTITGLQYLNTSEVKDMSYMFYTCHGLTSLDLRTFNTENVVAMRSMFAACVNLTSLNVTSFNTSKLVRAMTMFSSCPLTTIDLSSFDTSNVNTMSEMFDNCTKLESLNLSRFDTGKVLTMNYMFNNCSSLQTIYVGDGWNVTNVANAEGMFTNCENLVGGNGTVFDASVIDKTYACIDDPGTPGYLTRPGAYVVLSTDGTKLTFLCDGQRDSWTENTTYDLNQVNAVPVWSKSETNIRENITSVEFDPSFANALPVTADFWFNEMNNLEEIIGLEYLNTSRVAGMQYMFYRCRKVTELDLSQFDTQNVTNMNCMFQGCNGLTSLDLSGFNTSNVTSMFQMFNGCNNLSSINLEGFDTQNVTLMSAMFKGCSSLEVLDLSSFNTAKVTSMTEMFNNDSNLTTIYVGNGWSTNALTASSGGNHLFQNCTRLVGGAGTVFDANHDDKTYARIDQPASSLPGYFTGLPEVYYVYEEASGIMTHYYDSKKYLREYESSQDGHILIGEGQNYDGGYWIQDCNGCTEVVFDPSYANTLPNSANGALDDYFGFQNLNYVRGLEYFNIDGITTFANMFYGCSQLKELDLSSFDTRNITSMINMFNGCSSLKTVYVGDKWTTENVTTSTDMFKDCTSIVGSAGTTFSSSHIDAAYAHVDGGTSNPGYLSELPSAYVVYDDDNTKLTFYYDGQKHLRTGTVFELNEGTDQPEWYNVMLQTTTVEFDASFAEARPTSTCQWFYGSQELTRIIGLSNLNTSEVTVMNRMFGWGLQKMPTLNLATFDTHNVTDMERMFLGCGFTTTIYVGDGWNVDNVTNSTNMFSGCISLVGGAGTEFSYTNIDKTYAHIDGGTSNPGYLTLAPEAYAVLSDDHTTFTLYCDGLKSTRTGTVYELGGWLLNTDQWRTLRTQVTTLKFDASFAEARPTSTNSWFYGMTALETIEGIEYLNTTEVTDMANMFYYCSTLKSLDLSGFYTRNVTRMDNMFYVCTALTTVYVSDEWSTENVTSSSLMFRYCSAIKGGKGTVYNNNNTDAAYAHIDGGTSNPGYFTEKLDFLLGDVNGDGKITIADVTALVDIILGKDSAGTFNRLAADVNQDSSITIADVTKLVDIILGK